MYDQMRPSGWVWLPLIGCLGFDVGHEITKNM